MKLEPYQPRTHQVYWCSRCDCTQVDSNKAETGIFTLAFGHAFSQGSKEYDGDYVGVMFAICRPCLDTN